MADVQLRTLTKSYDGQLVLHDVNLSVASGQYLVLLGPSGCGKTTLLKLIAGLENADQGSVLLADRCVDCEPARKRDVSLVFQHDGLYPHLSIRESIGMGLGHLSNEETKRRIDQATQMTDLDGLLDRRPEKLSGGQRQRASIAKAIARRASVRLFDEPLAALDSHVRHNIQESLITWHRQYPGTTIHVTHDGHEAMRVADLIAVLSPEQSLQDAGADPSSGVTIVQVATPEEVYRNPCNQTVALSLGTPPMNFLRATIQNGQVAPANADVHWNSKMCPNLPEKNPITIGVRPDSCQILVCGDTPESVVQPDPHDETLRFAGLVQREYSSNGRRYGVVNAHNESLTIDLTGQPTCKGQHVLIQASTSDVHLFDTATGRALQE